MVTDSFVLAARICNSDAVLSVFASSEWDELNDDGKAWIAAVIEAAIAEDRAGRQFAHDIILDNLVSWGVLTDEHQDDPRAALWKLIELERDAARDPRIDEKAAEMVAKAIAEREAQLVKWLREKGEIFRSEYAVSVDPDIMRLADAIEAKEPWK